MLIKKKFADDKFLPSNEVLASSHNSISNIKWLRPHDICSRNGYEPPKMVVDGTNRFDINQGAIGNCWFQGMFCTTFLVFKIGQNFKILQLPLPNLLKTKLTSIKLFPKVKILMTMTMLEFSVSTFGNVALGKKL